MKRQIAITYSIVFMLLNIFITLQASHLNYKAVEPTVKQQLSRYTYTRQEKELELKTKEEIYNYRARLYGPKLKRFFSPDKVKQQYGAYTYVAGNPVSFIDPDGKELVLVSEDELKDGRTQYYEVAYERAMKFLEGLNADKFNSLYNKLMSSPYTVYIRPFTEQSKRIPKKILEQYDKNSYIINVRVNSNGSFLSDGPIQPIIELYSGMIIAWAKIDQNVNVTFSKEEKRLYFKKLHLQKRFNEHHERHYPKNDLIKKIMNNPLLPINEKPELEVEKGGTQEEMKENNMRMDRISEQRAQKIQNLEQKIKIGTLYKDKKALFRNNLGAIVESRQLDQKVMAWEMQQAQVLNEQLNSEIKSIISKVDQMGRL